MIAERDKRLAQSERQQAIDELSEVHEATSDGIMEVDRSWTICYMNGPATAISGSQANGAITRTFGPAFYTTEGIHGTGLGLWISKRIIHKHRGYMKVRSSSSGAKKRTVFSRWLPIQVAETVGDKWHVEDLSEASCSTQDDRVKAQWL